MWRPEEDTFEVKPNLSRDGFSEVDRKCNSLLPGVFRVLLWGVMDFFVFIKLSLSSRSGTLKNHQKMTKNILFLYCSILTFKTEIQLYYSVNTETPSSLNLRYLSSTMNMKNTGKNNKNETGFAEMSTTSVRPPSFESSHLTVLWWITKSGPQLNELKRKTKKNPISNICLGACMITSKTKLNVS